MVYSDSFPLIGGMKWIEANIDPDNLLGVRFHHSKKRKRSHSENEDLRVPCTVSLSIENEEGKGLGVKNCFQSVPFEDGVQTCVGEYRGVVTAQRPSSAYVMGHEVNGKQVYVDAADQGSIVSFVNMNSTNPNCEIIHKRVEGVIRFFLFTLREIDKDEFLSYSYFGNIKNQKKHQELSKLHVRKARAPIALRKIAGKSHGTTYVCSNRTAYAPSGGHVVQTLLCQQCSEAEQYPVAYCTQFCHDMHVFALTNNDPLLIEQTKPKKNRPNATAPVFE